MNKIIWKINVFIYGLVYKIIKHSSDMRIHHNVNEFFDFIYEDGEPKNCVCGCNKFEMCDKDYTANVLCEYGYKCKDCGKLVGYWAYGNWDI